MGTLIKNTLEIIKADNGFIVIENFCKEVIDGHEIYDKNITLISESEFEDDCDREVIRHTMLKAAEWMGVNYDKYGKDNIDIRFDKKGHKVD